MKLYLLSFIALFSISLNAQKIISGKVTDGEETLPFATVVIKDSNTGVVADESGIFEISVNPSDTLSVSFLGFKETNIVVGNRKSLDLVLELDNTLDEVLVVGYQTTTSIYRKGCCCGITTVTTTITNDENSKVKQIKNRLFPNPSTDGIFQFKLKPDYKDVTIIVSDLQGKLINRFNLNAMDKPKVDLSNSAKGIYIFTIYNNGKRVETLKGIKG